MWSTSPHPLSSLCLNPVALCQADPLLEWNAENLLDKTCVCTGCDRGVSILVKIGAAALTKMDKSSHSTQNKLEKWEEVKFMSRLRALREDTCKTLLTWWSGFVVYLALVNWQHFLKALCSNLTVNLGWGYFAWCLQFIEKANCAAFLLRVGLRVKILKSNVTWNIFSFVLSP